MRAISSLIFLCSIICLSARSQEVASYYFYNTFQEFTQKYPALMITGEEGEFLTEIVPKLGQTPRQVYHYPKGSGLVFDYSKTKGFFKGSYAVEMYFKYESDQFMMYGSLLGKRLKERIGDYIHVVTTRDFDSKQIIAYIDGEVVTSFIDKSDANEVDANDQIIFFTDKEQPTTSGAVAMIKIYNHFIDEEKAAVLFEPFVVDEGFDRPSVENKKIVLKRLYFVQSLPKLLPESIPEMESLRDFMKTNQALKIQLTGHTDNQGDFDLNLKLSRERAENVKSFLVENGINPKRIKTKGYGNLRPIASNATEETRRLNRRVELEILD